MSRPAAHNTRGSYDTHHELMMGSHEGLGEALTGAGGGGGGGGGLGGGAVQLGQPCPGWNELL